VPWAGGKGVLFLKEKEILSEPLKECACAVHGWKMGLNPVVSGRGPVKRVCGLVSLLRWQENCLAPFTQS
jgi:hypothetical protein